MKVLSLNIGQRREIEWKGRTIVTGFYKEPVNREVLVSKEGLNGDCIVDKKVHGGIHKAIYVYFQVHYEWWREQTRREDMKPGIFGENFTVDSLDESDICGGDKLRFGGALLQAVNFRLPCYKLGIRMEDDEFPGIFMDSRRFGVYFKVVEEGMVKAGDTVSIVEEDPSAVSMKRIISAVFDEDSTADSIREALTIASLAPDLRERLSRRLRSVEVKA